MLENLTPFRQLIEYSSTEHVSDRFCFGSFHANTVSINRPLQRESGEVRMLTAFSSFLRTRGKHSIQ